MCSFYFYYFLTTGWVKPINAVFSYVVNRHREFVRLALGSLCTISNWIEYDVEAVTRTRLYPCSDMFAMETDNSEDSIRFSTGCFDWDQGDIVYLLQLTHAIRYHDGKWDRNHSLDKCVCTVNNTVVSQLVDDEVPVPFDNTNVPYWEAEMWGKVSFDNGYRFARNKHRRICKIKT
jgi:hypothetical protein